MLSSDYHSDCTLILAASVMDYCAFAIVLDSQSVKYSLLASGTIQCLSPRNEYLGMKLYCCLSLHHAVLMNLCVICRELKSGIVTAIAMRQLHSILASQRESEWITAR
jgi:hypothetical protein